MCCYETSIQIWCKNRIPVEKFLFLFLLLLHGRCGILVFEAADLLSCGLLERFFHHLYRTYLRRLADALVGDLEHLSLPTVKLFVELVLALLVPLDEVFIRLHESHQLAVTFYDDRLAYPLHVVDHILDLLGIDVLA